jgi:ribosomal protein L11 methyltransferase
LTRTSTRPWTTVRVRSPNDRAAIISALFELGAEGIQELDDEVVTHLRDIDERRVTAGVREVDPAAIVEYEPTPDVDWSTEWKSRIGAHRLGPLVVTPPWLAEQFSASERVVIDPGMAFGTGEHETTRGVLRLLARHVRPGDSVADLGAGSAVLSIAAAKLGAARVVAIELDPDAIGDAMTNIARNGVGGVVSVLEGDASLLLPLVAPVRLVLANIISSVLIQLLPVIAHSLATGGVAILSGILIDEKLSIEQALAAGGWRILEDDAEGIWWTVTITR